MTNEELPHTNLTPNWALRSAAMEWHEAAIAANRPAPLASRPTPAKPQATATPSPAAPAHLATGSTPAVPEAPALGPTARLTAALSGRHGSRRAGMSTAAERPLPLPDWALGGGPVRGAVDMHEAGAAAEGALADEDDVEGSRVGGHGEAMEQGDKGEREGDGESPRVGISGMEGGAEAARGPAALLSGVRRDDALAGQEDLEGGDVVMMDAGFDDGQGNEEPWPEVPTHRIARAGSQRERVPALA